MTEQAWTEDANDADRHLAVLMGDVFVDGWAFGDVVRLADAAMARPQMVNPAMVTT